MGFNLFKKKDSAKKKSLDEAPGPTITSEIPDKLQAELDAMPSLDDASDSSRFMSDSLDSPDAQAPGQEHASPDSTSLSFSSDQTTSSELDISTSETNDVSSRQEDSGLAGSSGRENDDLRSDRSGNASSSEASSDDDFSEQSQNKSNDESSSSHETFQESSSDDDNASSVSRQDVSASGTTNEIVSEDDGFEVQTNPDTSSSRSSDFSQVTGQTSSRKHLSSEGDVSKQLFEADLPAFEDEYEDVARIKKELSGLVVTGKDGSEIKDIFVEKQKYQELLSILDESEKVLKEEINRQKSIFETDEKMSLHYEDINSSFSSIYTFLSSTLDKIYSGRE